jgi:hypothetical protein
MAVNNLNSGVGIQPTIVDAKGDLIAATANDAVNRLAVGTNGQVLVADSGETTGLKWNNPGSVGGLVHIETQTFSAASAVSFNNVFSSAYDNYVLRGSYLGSAASHINLRLRASGTDASASNYERQNLGSSATTTSSIRQIGRSSFEDVMLHSTTENHASMFELTNPFKVVPTFGINVTPFVTAGNLALQLDARRHTLSTSYDGFSIIVASGNITGDFSVYGYAKV